MAHPTSEDFDAWRDNPVTRWVMAALKTAADENKELWMLQSWEQRKLDPLELSDLRVRADAYMAMAETPYEGWVDFNGGDQSGE